MSVGEQIDCYIDGHKLKRVDRFKHLGSYQRLQSRCRDHCTDSDCVMRYWKTSGKGFRLQKPDSRNKTHSVHSVRHPSND